MNSPRASHPSVTQAPPPPAPFWAACRFWFKLGWISFGGPAGQIAILHQELVIRRRWISEKRFLHALNFCMVLPGPEAQQLTTYMGWLMHKTLGGLVAGLLFVLPSLFVLVGLSWLYVTCADWPILRSAFEGIKPAVTAIVIHAAHRIGTRLMKQPRLWTISVGAFIGVVVLQWPFALILCLAAAVAWLWHRIDPRAFTSGSAHVSHASEHAKAWIDDDTPLPAHAQVGVSAGWRVVAVGVVLACVPLAWALLTQGVDHLLVQLGWFFTKAALLTFGGAYAVLPYVHQGAVVEQGWLTASQMMDGLALGETTPGPLIMVVAFVGFLAGHATHWPGVESAFWSGFLAACWVTWFTFLPSFVFILAGAPWVERTQRQLQWAAPLTGISAAVLGVMAQLALTFAQHSLWPLGLAGPLNWGAMLIAVCSAVALIRFKRGVWEVIALSALAGVGLSWLQS